MKQFLVLLLLSFLALFPSIRAADGPPGTTINCPITFSDSFCMTCNSAGTACQACSSNYYPHDETSLCSRTRSGNGETPSEMVNNVRTFETGDPSFNFMNGVVVQELDPYCSLNTNSLNNNRQSATCALCVAYPNLYPTTQQAGPGGNIQSYENLRYLSDNNLTCHSSCDYSTYGMYSTTSGQTAICSACSPDCISCTSTSANKCNECIYAKQRMQSGTNIDNFLPTSSAGQLTCTTNRLASTKTLVYYVAPAGNSKRCGGGCSNSDDGTGVLWDDLNMVFRDIITQSSSYTAVDVKIYLLKTGTNLMHYLLDDDDDPNFYSYDYITPTTNGHLPRPFERTLASVYIGPIYCSDKPTQAGCLSAGEKPTIKWKSSVANIFVTKELVMENVIIDGADLTYENIEGAYPCTKSRKECCQYDSTTETTNTVSSPSFCVSVSSDYAEWSVSSTTFKNKYKTSQKYGIFVLEYIRDSSDAAIPSLTITKCEIKNFFYSKYHTSFIQMNNFAGKVLIEDSSFDRFFFPHGLISNSHQVIDRSLFGFSSFNGETCRSLQNSAATYCHNITIKNSDFKNYNPLKTTYLETDDVHNIEGAVLALHNMDGPITIEGCDFENMLAFSRMSTTEDMQHDCLTYDPEKWGAEDKGQSRHNIGPESLYKVYLDKHFRKYAENTDVNTSITAVVHLRNVTQGLVIHKNTFNSIYTLVGGAIYIEGFNNTFGAPIIISGNTFTNNFAQFMGANIFIYKYSYNIPRLNCSGIYVDSNIFSDNYGCKNTIGNVVLACEANDYNGYSGLTGDEAFETYYSTYSITSNQAFENDVYSYRNFTRYLKSISSDKDYDYSYTHPLDSSVSLNPNRVTFSNNIFKRNYMKLSNGLYIQGVMNLLVDSNTFSSNSIPTADAYLKSEFSDNAFQLTSNIIPAMTADPYMVESVPLLIRQSNYIQIKNNIFDGNTQGFLGGDYYMAQAITLHQLLGQDEVYMKNNTFSNHQGFSSALINYTGGHFDFASSPMISFNFWELSDEYLKGLDDNNDNVQEYPSPNSFTIDGCTFENNVFDFKSSSDTKSYYYSPKDSSLYQSYLYPFSHLLKYFSVQEVVGTTGTDTSTFDSAVSYSSGPVMISLHVTITDSTIRNNTFNNGFCAFTSFWYNQFTISSTDFEDNVIPSGAQGANGLICAIKENVYSKWNNGSTLYFSELTFNGDSGSLFYLTSIGSKDPLSVYSYAINLNDIEIYETTSDAYAPIYASSASSVSIETVTATYFFGTYGLIYLDSTSSFNADYITVENSVGKYTGIMYAKSVSTTVLSHIVGKNNTFSDADDANDVNFVSGSGLGWETIAINLDISKVLALVKQSGGTLTIQESKFYDSDLKLGFMVTAGKLILTDFEAYDLTIRDSIVFAVGSSTVTMTGADIHDNTSGDDAISGVAIIDSSKLISASSDYYSLTAPKCGFLFAQLSTITLTSVNVSYVTVSGANAVIQAYLGTVTITGSTFSYNEAQEGESMIQITLGALKLSTSTFAYNKASSRTNGLYLVKTLGTVTISLTDFISSESYNSESDLDAEFLVIYDSSVSISGSTFTGANNGAVYSSSKSNALNMSNVTVKNNYAPSTKAVLYVLGDLSISDSEFENNTNTLYTETDTLSISDSTFTSEIEASVLVSCTSTDGSLIEFSNVTFDGNPDSTSLWDIDTIANDTSNSIRAIYLTSCSGVVVEDCLFKNLKSTSTCGSGLHTSSEDSTAAKYTIEITGSTFYNTISSYGGAICIENLGDSLTQIDIDSTVINECKAVTNGGGIYYNSFETSLKSGLYTADDGVDYMNLNAGVEIKNCEAGSAGGAIYYTKLRPNATNALASGDLFTSNSAPYGSNWASYPVKLAVFVSSTTSTETSRLLSEESNRILSTTTTTYTEGTLADFVSGQQIDPPILIGLVDIDDQLVANWDSSTITMTFTDTTNLKASTTTTFESENGLFTFDPLILSFPPGSSTEVTLQSSVEIVSSDIITNTGEFTLKIKPYFRNCGVGERLTDDNECSLCSSGTALFEVNSKSKCSSCPANMDCYGGSVIGPVSGYFRFSKWNDYAVECVNDEACLGNTISQANSNYYCKSAKNSTFCETGWCSEKYTGNMCATCNSGYAKSSDIYCVACSNNPMYYVLAVILIVAAIGFIVFTVRNALKLKDFTKDGAKPKTSILIKIFLNYVQLVSIVSSFDFEWPSQVTGLFSVQSKVSSSSSTVFSVDCFLPSSGTIRPFFSKLLFISLSPFFLILISLGVWFIIFKVKKWTDWTRLKSNVTTTCVVILFMIHTTLVQTSILGFRCTNIGDASGSKTEYYLAQDLEVECWGSTHLFWVFAVALPAFIVWGLGIPFFAYRILKKNQLNLESNEFKSKYGFLYDGYKSEKYYWEFVVLYRKIIMIFISVFMVTYGTTIQSLAVLGVAFVSFMLQLRGVPFQQNDLNTMEKRGLISATITLYCGIYYITKELPTAVNILLIVVIFAVNGAFFATWLALLLKEYKKEIFKKFFKKNKNQVGIALAIFGKNNENGKASPTLSPELSKMCKEDEIEKGEECEIRPLTPVAPGDELSFHSSSPPSRLGKRLKNRPFSRNRVVPISSEELKLENDS